MSSLADKTLFITGASRGIGLAIGLRAAADGANVAIAAKTDRPHPKLPGTVHTAAAEIETAGGQALPLVTDIRDADAITAAVEQTAEAFGGIDILVNNASAISLTGTLETPAKRYDLMHAVNGRGTFLCAQACIPHLRRAANPHILTLSPPINLNPRWFAPHGAYTIAKYAMSLCTLTMAEEFRAEGIAVNSLWPRTLIATAALAMLGSIPIERCRRPAILADAAHVILTRDARESTGNFHIDEDVLIDAGVADLSRYAMDPTAELLPDLFLD